MWCTRWFIPLLILPLPSSPPYFLILFLISMIIHARPCFYCIILLTALFLSSCYWQPIPLITPVSSSWGINATFATVLTAALSSSVAAPLPAVIRLADRCWCDVSTSRLFEPFDIARWERTSVEQLKEEIERDTAYNPNSLRLCHPCIRPSSSTTAEPSSIKTPTEQGPTSHVPSVSPLSNGPPVVPSADLPLLRRKYDLRPYGFQMILDFGWSREE
ncbi:hypothetical protein F5148DRAFT_1011732 [Russula earlei]|uniref:Uncharacterized protein n=1 Tax=Russula earlei TaxID=71964 RepID=A0ACC0UEY1_9AGAM|nr:hypothetical protein F5148DRAFT_1011732 [Russula earlei]